MKYPTLLIILMLFASCESDQTTSNPGTTSGEKKLVLSPTQLEGDQYVEYEFKAKVTNVPSSDVAFYWDFDEGNGFEHHEEQFIRQRFYQDKVHNVRVKALDYFSGLLLGFDSIRVDIRPQVAFASITPKLVDTILVMASSGEMTESLFFKIKASIPDNFIRSEWDFGDGTVPVFGADTSPTHL